MNLSTSIKRLVLGTVAALIWLFSGAISASAGPKVVASIFPLYDFVREVGGERVEAHLLLPPGAEPHSWEPRPSDVLAIYRADLLVVMGAGLEPWLDDILSGLKKREVRIMVASRGAKLIYLKGEKPHRAVDPHLWLDLDWDQRIVLSLAEELTRLDPSGKEYYQHRARRYAQALAQLDQRYAKGLSRCRSRTILVAGHGAYGYLARRYGLRQVALFGLSPEAEPSPRKMIEILTLARSLKAEAIFFETRANRRLAQALSDEAGLKALVLNPGASLTQEELQKGTTFLAIMEENLKALRTGLSCLP